MKRNLLYLLALMAIITIPAGASVTVEETTDAE